MTLPKAYQENIKCLFKDQYDAYLACLKEPCFIGIRINTNKINIEDFKRISPFKLKAIPWTKDGFYVLDDLKPAKHPFYHAGLYYVQEPSAMAPVETMPLNNQDVVLDLCAAPGGKSLQIANTIGNQGVLVANDISASRLKAVVANIERWGIKNAIVISEDIKKIVEHHADYYDHILVDAPCSGEGMFRKDSRLIKSWSRYSNEDYAKIQSTLTVLAFKCLKRGGTLTYSTCTFSPIENEAVYLNLLDSDVECYARPIDSDIFSKGIVTGKDERSLYCARLYPFVQEGEGHFIASAKREGEDCTNRNNTVYNNPPEYLKIFMDDVLNMPIKGKFRECKGKVYLDPEIDIPLEGFRILRKGWLLGAIEKSKFIPAHSFAMGLDFKQIKRKIDLKIEDIRVLKYLKCETICCEQKDNGWYVVCVEGFPLGWGKCHNGQLKNKYPPHLRVIYEN